MYNIKNRNRNRIFPEVEICDFDWLFSFDSYLPNLSLNSTKMITIES